MAVMENGIRKGFTLCSFTGEERLFAHEDFKTTNKFFNYYYDLSVFETFGVSILEAAKNSSGLIVMDEIGKMEANTIQFRNTIIDCLDSPLPVLGVFQQRAIWFRETIKNRSDVKIYEVTMEDGGKISDEIVKSSFFHSYFTLELLN